MTTMHSDGGGAAAAAGHAVKLDGNSICEDKNKKRIFSAPTSIGAKVVQGQAAGKRVLRQSFFAVGSN